MVRPFKIEDYQQELLAIFQALTQQPHLAGEGLRDVLRAHPRGGRDLFSRNELITAYRHMAGQYGLPPYDEALVKKLQRKPIRSLSGVTPVTILTKPFPCPGTCIFCPNDVRMPKSYLADEPGAQRAAMHAFDPYLQTYSRLLALASGGHPTDKIELIILGGTWSFYPESYQIWFIKRAFDALHDFGAGRDARAEVEAGLASSRLHPRQPAPRETIHGASLERSYNQMVATLYPDEIRDAPHESATWDALEACHAENENAACRCVGLVIETRPDYLDEAEALRLRRLGCTKVQLGIQSLNEAVLRLNKRGHGVQRTRQAIRALRAAGFKIHAHWMPNLYGSSPQEDIADFQRLFTDPDIKPDELKVYPCSLIESAELMQVYQRGDWRPYTEAELLEVLVAAFQHAPDYCRLTRVIRDIPSTDIVVGNKKTNFREIVERELLQRGIRSREIRSREIKGQAVALEDLRLSEMRYNTSLGEEIFLQYITADEQIAGFLRLSLPMTPPITPELADSAMIREVHVYGEALSIGRKQSGSAQHVGLGTRLIERAVEIATERGYARLAVISAVGTRGYYRKRGFTDGPLYQSRALGPASISASNVSS
jgi:elongator complex protein 3